MKVGDLVRFRKCAQVGMLGIITAAHKQSHLSRENPALRLYQVVFEGGEQCFTGNQLALV